MWSSALSTAPSSSKKGDVYVGLVTELNVSSFGDTLNEREILRPEFIPSLRSGQALSRGEGLQNDRLAWVHLIPTLSDMSDIPERRVIHDTAQPSIQCGPTHLHVGLTGVKETLG